MRCTVTFVLLVFAQAAGAQCKLSDFEAKITKVSWYDGCRQQSCPVLKGAAVVTNHCSTAAGVELRIIGLDANDTPIAVRELWPFSTDNIPAGTQPFSIDQWLDYDPGITSFTLQPVRVRVW